MSYVFKPFKFKKEEKIKLILKDSYDFNFSNNEICIKIYDKDLISNYLTKKYYKDFKKIVNLLLSLLETDDNDDEDINLVLDEISRLESLIISLYKKHLSIDVIKRMLKEIFILKEELKNKMLKEYRNRSI